MMGIAAACEAETVAPPAREIGIPITSANRVGSKTARGFGKDGHDLLCWTTTAESGGYFCAMDLVTGKTVSHPLHHLEAYPIVFGSDGCVYTGSTSGEVMRWNPKTDAWGPLGKPLFAWPGASLNHVRVLCEGPDKWLYAGSVYGERARIHLETGEIEKLPPLPEAGHWYVSAAETLPDGQIAFGCGYQARLFIYDPKLKKDVGQWLPEDWTHDGFVFNVLVGKTVVYATHFPSGRRGAFELATGKFLGEIPWPLQKTDQRWSIWGFGAGFDFYVLPGTDTAVTCDGKVVHQWNPHHPDLPPTLPLQQFNPPSDMALSLRYDVTTDVQVHEYDRLRMHIVKMVRPPQPPAARNLNALDVGPDGCIYGGAYQSTELFRYDPRRRELKMLGDHHPGWSGETFSFTNWHGELVCASYTNGAMVAYDPRKPWNAKVGKMVNPRRLGFLGQSVYRPFSVCVAEDGKVWGVGPAGWGTTGGGIAWIDPRDGKTASTPLPEAGNDIVALPGDRLLVCSNSLLRWWDGKTNREIAQCAPPVPLVSVTPRQSGTTSEMLMASPGKLLIASVKEPGKVEILRRFPSPIPCSRALLYEGKAIVGGPQGFASVDLTTGESKVFCSTPLGHRWAFAVTEGSVFFHSGAHLMTAPITKE